MNGKMPRNLSLTWLAACGVQVVVGGALASQSWSYGGMGPEKMLDDLMLYHRYASRTFAGALPYRDFPIEYPVLSVPVFLLPRVFGASVGAYRVAFAAEMLGWNALIVGLLARWVGSTEGDAAVARRLGWYTLFFLSLCPMILVRFDLAPTALGFAAAMAWGRGRNRFGGFLAGAGFLMKLFPGVVAVPAFVVEVSRWRTTRGRGVLAFGGTILVGVALWLILGGAGVARSFSYHMERGLEIGSLYSGASIALAKATGAEVSTHFNHSSTELIAPWSAPLARLALPIQGAALLLVMWRVVRSGGQDPLRFAGAAVLAFLLFGKVLSPQYLIWLLPFVAAWNGPTGRWARPVFLGSCLLTTLIYPWGSDRLVSFDLLAVAALNGRNLLLLFLYGLLVFGPVAQPRTTRALEANQMAVTVL